MSATTSPRPPRALLLDDDPTVLRLLGARLEARGVEVRASADGDAGMALLLDELLDLDVLVVDLELPGRDGWEVLHLVRRAGGERDLRVAVLASAPGRAVREQLYALGADVVVNRRAGAAAAADAIAALAGAPGHRARPARPALEGTLALAYAPARAPRLTAAPA